MAHDFSQTTLSILSITAPMKGRIIHNFKHCTQLGKIFQLNWRHNNLYPYVCNAIYSPHPVWGSNYLVCRPAPAACSSIAQTYWTRRCEVIDCALVRDVFISAYLTMMRLGGWIAFTFLLVGGSPTKGVALKFCLKLSKIALSLETSSKF